MKNLFCLSFVVFLLTTNSSAQSFDIGKVKDLANQTKASPIEGVKKVQLLKKNSSIKTDQIYTSDENSWVNINIFDASWIRINPATKLLFKYDPKEKHLSIDLFSGSVKVVVSKNLSPKGLQKISVNSAHAHFSSSDAKFSVSRNDLFEITNLYVEKGTVVGHKEAQNIIVHTLETTSVGDGAKTFSRVRKMDDKEAKFVLKNLYLKNNEL